jgi:hypothetical protein
MLGDQYAMANDEQAIRSRLLGDGCRRLHSSAAQSMRPRDIGWPIGNGIHNGLATGSPRSPRPRRTACAAAAATAGAAHSAPAGSMTARPVSTTSSGRSARCRRRTSKRQVRRASASERRDGHQARIENRNGSVARADRASTNGLAAHHRSMISLLPRGPPEHFLQRVQFTMWGRRAL